MMTEHNQNLWRKCSTCKKPINLGAKYYVCSVSTCNGQRTGYVFCSMQCFETHLPGARHRDAGAIEKYAPKVLTPAETEKNQDDVTPTEIYSSQQQAPGRRIIVNSNQVHQNKSTSTANQKLPQEVLIIASRLKDYIQSKGEMNTSASVMDLLSDKVRKLCDEAIENAQRDGRKTVMDRDFKS